MIHFLKQSKCIKHLTISGDWIKCEVCGAEIGFTYYYGEELKLFIFLRYKLFTRQIKKWVYEHTKEREHTKNSSEQELGDALYNLKKWVDDGVLFIENEECEEETESGGR